VEAIAKATTVMNRIIQDLLQMARIEAGSLHMNLVQLSVEPVLREVVNAMRPAASARNLELSCDFGDALPAVQADRERLVQVLENLVNNAIKFTPEHGCVRVGAQLGVRELLFRVTDTGCGISEQDLERVFDRFQRGSRHHVDGSGLGLAIAEGIVEAHGGRIWAESALGRGTTFYFTLPTTPAASSPITG
jgi:signal transduction histidine kinase